MGIQQDMEKQQDMEYNTQNNNISDMKYEI